MFYIVFVFTVTSGASEVVEGVEPFGGNSGSGEAHCSAGTSTGEFVCLPRKAPNEAPSSAI